MKNLKHLLVLILALLMSGCVSAEDETGPLPASAQTVHDSQRYLSIVYTVAEETGNGLHETLHAQTYARDGLYAGQELTLTQLLGLEQDGDEEPSIASQLVYDLIWQIVEADRQNIESEYLEELSRTDFENAFFPERDFYLDEDGNAVFFIQTGEIAVEAAGVLIFPFAPAELLSAVHESENGSV